MYSTMCLSCSPAIYFSGLYSVGLTIGESGRGINLNSVLYFCFPVTHTKKKRKKEGFFSLSLAFEIEREGRRKKGIYDKRFIMFFFLANCRSLFWNARINKHFLLGLVDPAFGLAGVDERRVHVRERPTVQPSPSARFGRVDAENQVHPISGRRRIPVPSQHGAQNEFLRVSPRVRWGGLKLN